MNCSEIAGNFCCFYFLFHSVRSAKKIFNAFSSLLFSNATLLWCVIIYVSKCEFFTLIFSCTCSHLIYTNKYISGYFTVIFKNKIWQWQNWVNVVSTYGKRRGQRVYCHRTIVKYPFLSNWFCPAWCTQQTLSFLRCSSTRFLKILSFQMLMKSFRLSDYLTQFSNVVSNQVCATLYQAAC